MSSDLLREFGSPEVHSWPVVASQNIAKKISVDEDDFGDFEDPENEEDVSNTPGNRSPPTQNAKGKAILEWTGLQLPSMNQGDLQYHPPRAEVQDTPSNDHEWGDFPKQTVIFDADMYTMRQEKEVERIIVDEERTQEAANTLLHPMISKIGSSPASGVPAKMVANRSRRVQEQPRAGQQSSRDYSKRRIETTKATDSEQATTDDEPWVDFEAAQAAQPVSKSSNTLPLRLFTPTEASNLGTPPSNIPPPSILLPLIATVLGSLATTLQTITSAQCLNQPGSSSQIRALLSTTRAAARVLAGRRLRWRRDYLLSQSMKIGPARSGRAGGMKLTGVDKAESQREDQEAAEMLQVWKEQAGLLKSTIATLNGQVPANERFKISEVADNVPIRQGKTSEGIVAAPKCCFLCGIKRDERVAKVDVDVEDSFGEYWVEHWGHFDCVAFWENHKDLLRQR